MCYYLLTSCKEDSEGKNSFSKNPSLPKKEIPGLPYQSNPYKDENFDHLFKKNNWFSVDFEGEGFKIKKTKENLYIIEFKNLEGIYQLQKPENKKQENSWRLNLKKNEKAKTQLPPSKIEVYKEKEKLFVEYNNQKIRFFQIPTIEEIIGKWKLVSFFVRKENKWEEFPLDKKFQYEWFFSLNPINKKTEPLIFGSYDFPFYKFKTFLSKPLEIRENSLLVNEVNYQILNYEEKNEKKFLELLLEGNKKINLIYQKPTKEVINEENTGTSKKEEKPPILTNSKPKSPDPLQIPLPNSPQSQGDQSFEPSVSQTNSTPNSPNPTQIPLPNSPQNNFPTYESNGSISSIDSMNSTAVEIMEAYVEELEKSKKENKTAQREIHDYLENSKAFKILEDLKTKIDNQYDNLKSNGLIYEVGIKSEIFFDLLDQLKIKSEESLVELEENMKEDKLEVFFEKAQKKINKYLKTIEKIEVIYNLEKRKKEIDERVEIYKGNIDHESIEKIKLIKNELESLLIQIKKNLNKEYKIQESKFGEAENKIIKYETLVDEAISKIKEEEEKAKEASKKIDFIRTTRLQSNQCLDIINKILSLPKKSFFVIKENINKLIDNYINELLDKIEENLNGVKDPNLDFLKESIYLAIRDKLKEQMRSKAIQIQNSETKKKFSQFIPYIDCLSQGNRSSSSHINQGNRSSSYTKRESVYKNIEEITQMILNNVSSDDHPDSFNRLLNEILEIISKNQDLKNNLNHVFDDLKEILPLLLQNIKEFKKMFLEATNQYLLILDQIIDKLEAYIFSSKEDQKKIENINLLKNNLEAIHSILTIKE